MGNSLSQHHPKKSIKQLNPKKSISSHDGGLSLTLDNKADVVSWTSINNGYYTTQFYHVSIDPSNTKPDLVIGGMQDNGTWKSEIKNETIAAKKLLLEADTSQSKKDLATRFSRALASFRSKERQIFTEVKQQIILLVLKRTVTRAQETFGKKDRAAALINDTINKLEGDLL